VEATIPWRPSTHSAVDQVAVGQWQAAAILVPTASKSMDIDAMVASQHGRFPVMVEQVGPRNTAGITAVRRSSRNAKGTFHHLACRFCREEFI